MSVEAYRVLAVCTGNICRSPAAQLLLHAELGAGATVTSAGTAAMVGNPIEPPMAKLLRESGHATSAFAARQLVAEDIIRADLILTMTREHRARTVALVPAAVRRTFTLLELARIAASGEVPRLLGITPRVKFLEFVAAAGRQRSSGKVISDDDVPDPYRRGGREYRASYALISGAVDKIAAALR